MYRFVTKEELHALPFCIFLPSKRKFAALKILCLTMICFLLAALAIY